jgi:L-amino acid N-acyltransferase YncA
MTLRDEEIGLAMAADIAGILDLQEDNLSHQGGALSVGHSRKWFETAIDDMPVVVARKERRVVGYLVSSTFSAQAHVPIIGAMLDAYRGSDGAYIYGPICVAQSERRRGLAGRLFAVLRMQLPGREGIAFIRRDNTPSLGAHTKMGMRQVAQFTHDEVAYIILAYTSDPARVRRDVGLN